MKYNKFDRFLDVTFFILYQGSLYFEYKIKKFHEKKEIFFNNIKNKKELQKNYIFDSENRKEHKFSLRNKNKDITKNSVDEFLQLKEDVIDNKLVIDVMTYSLQENYRIIEIVDKMMGTNSFTYQNMFDELPYIAIKNKDVAIHILKNKDFINFIENKEESFELISKNIRRKSFDVVNYIFNSELKDKIIKDYVIAEERLMKLINKDTDDDIVLFVKEKLSLVRYEKLEKKLEVKNVKEKRLKI